MKRRNRTNARMRILNLPVVDDWLKEDWSMTALCEYYGVSRKTGYKWLSRFWKEGGTALFDRPRAPKSHPNATPAGIGCVRFLGVNP
jgi:transposase